MIVFDLRCTGGHVFEAWFGSSAAFHDQRERGLLCCPVCGDHQVEKAVVAPNVGAKGNRATGGGAPAVATPHDAASVKAAMAALAQAQQRALEGSRWVGRHFADQARAMHAGDQPHQPIHGQASPAEAKALVEDGVSVAPLPFPVVPPEACN